VLRLLRRWWPVPLVLVAALVGTQLWQDAQVRAEIDRRRQVAGVLHQTVDADLAPRESGSRDLLWTLASEVRTATASVVFREPTETSGRRLQAVSTADGTVEWTHDFDPPGTVADPDGYDYPGCAGDAEPATWVYCLVSDGDRNLTTDGSLPLPTATRLDTLDAATGEVIATEDLPPLTGGTTQDGVQYLASLDADGTELTVTARALPDREPLWTVTYPVSDQGLDPAMLLIWAPSMRLDRGHLLVQTGTAGWALDATDGRLQITGSLGLSVSRTGLIAESDAATRLFDTDGTVLLSDAASLAGLTVDDGSVPDLELLIGQERGNQRTIIAIAPGADEPTWTLERSGWMDGSLVLLDDVLYGIGSRQTWAVDARTGRELWATDLTAASNGYPVTDGEHLLVTTWGTVAATTGTGSATDAENQYLLTALRLSDGAVDWATPLPDDVQQVWEQGGELVAFRPDGSTVVLD
jgi:outer membrane protein assembly factor BamB